MNNHARPSEPILRQLKAESMMLRLFNGPLDRSIRVLLELVVAMWNELTPEQKDRVLKSLMKPN
jgi:hypothetical protein